jgi:hypothetical protein
MALTGITITELNPIGNDIEALDILPIVNVDLDETQKVSVQNFGNFILGNLANTLNLTVSNLTVSNTATVVGNTNLSNANVSGNITVVNTANVGNLRTDHLLYSNGSPWNLTNAAGNLGEVQFSNGLGNFTASNAFVWDNVANTLNVTNLNLLYANTDKNEGTSAQVLGITDQATQQIGWKTLPTNYMTVYLRDGNSYISSITPVLRAIPIRTHGGGYVQIPAA